MQKTFLFPRISSLYMYNSPLFYPADSWLTGVKVYAAEKSCCRSQFLFFLAATTAESIYQHRRCQFLPRQRGAKVHKNLKNRPFSSLFPLFFFFFFFLKSSVVSHVETRISKFAGIIKNCNKKKLCTAHSTWRVRH